MNTERESSFRLVYNKLSFSTLSLSSPYTHARIDEEEEKSYYASVDMQIRALGVVVVLVVIKFVRPHAAHMSLNTRLKANAISDKQIENELHSRSRRACMSIMLCRSLALAFRSPVSPVRKRITPRERISFTRQREMRFSCIAS